MDLWPYILPVVYLVFIESLAVRWIAGGPVPGLVSRIIAVNIAGIVLLAFFSLTGWFFGLWPDIRNWALRDSFFLFLILKAPVFAFLFRRWGSQKIFTLHILSNFASAMVLSLLFAYSPWVMAIKPVTIKYLNEQAITRLLTIRDAVEDYKITHGHYPNYIWGGDLKSWRGRSPDPLINEGYIAVYPVNPYNLQKTYFVPRRIDGWWELIYGAKDNIFLHVRSLWGPIVESDPRFGFTGTKMGNVLPDPCYPGTRLPENVKFSINYTFWLPGGFFYRSYDLDNNGTPDAYIMGVCGYEDSQATLDCYDARDDSLTRNAGGKIVPSAFDGIRDGVIYRIQRGFPETGAGPQSEHIPGLGVVPKLPEKRNQSPNGNPK